MTRPFQPIQRVEGQVFSVPTSPPTTSRSSQDTCISGEALEAAVTAAQVSFPSRPEEIALQALVTAMSLLKETSRAAGSLRVTSISEETVEAAAEGIYSLCGSNWDGIGYRLRSIYKDDARAILEAAAPHIQFASVFWEDLQEDMKNPEYAEEYAKTMREIEKDQNEEK